MKNRTKYNEPSQPKKRRKIQHNKQTQRANFNKNMACIINVIIYFWCVSISKRGYINADARTANQCLLKAIYTFCHSQQRSQRNIYSNKKESERKFMEICYKSQHNNNYYFGGKIMSIRWFWNGNELVWAMKSGQGLVRVRSICLGISFCVVYGRQIVLIYAPFFLYYIIIKFSWVLNFEFMFWTTEQTTQKSYLQSLWCLVLWKWRTQEFSFYCYLMQMHLLIWRLVKIYSFQCRKNV